MGEKKRADFYIDVMGHDINNLNQVIMAYLELLQETNPLEHSGCEFIEGAILATKESAYLVKSVKALWRATEESHEARDIDLSDAIVECIREVPKPAGKDVTYRFAPRRGILVKALPEIKLAFYNIIFNSIKYSGPDVRICIDITETLEEGGKRYATTIADDGPGIPDHVKRSLFDGFCDEAKAPPGKGLGLYAAKGLAEAFGGSLEVRDRVPGDYGKGTKVTIMLPAVAEVT